MNLGAILLVAVLTFVVPALTFIAIKYALKLFFIGCKKVCSDAGKMFRDTGDMVTKTIRGERV